MKLLEMQFRKQVYAYWCTCILIDEERDFLRAAHTPKTMVGQFTVILSIITILTEIAVR